MSRPVAVVTGASRGIGAAIAHALDESHDLVLVGRNEDALAVVAATLTGTPTPVAVDLCDHAAASAQLSHLDRVDVLVHAAGVASLAPIAEAAPGEWRTTFEVNVLAVVALTRSLLPALREARGHVIMINSGAGRVAKANWSAYSASKFALRAVADSLRAEEPGLRVTSIYPGRVATDMQRVIVAAEGGTYDAARYLSPESVAAAVRGAVEASPDAHPTDLVLRPRAV